MIKQECSTLCHYVDFYPNVTTLVVTATINAKKNIEVLNVNN